MGGGSGRKTAEGHLLAEFSEIRRQSRHGGAGRRVPAHAGWGRCAGQDVQDVSAHGLNYAGL